LLLASKNWQAVHIWEHELKGDISIMTARLKKML
jgi:hypothetical protein